jgi:acyl dehydratase
MQPEEITRAIGKTYAVRVFEVEKGAIRRFADAIGDTNPLYTDEEYAKTASWGTIIAPPGFFGWPVKHPFGTPLIITFPEELMASLEKAGYPREFLVDGGIEYEYSLPVRAGDILSCVEILKDARERTGKSGKLCILITEATYLNQNGDLVAKASSTYVLRSTAA